MEQKKYFFYFVFLLSILTIIRIILIPQFNLVPQEAYYWLFSQRLALSYFDHPPICSHTIALFTTIFGNNEFSVRIGMILYSIGTMVYLFLLARKIFNDYRLAFWSIVFLNLTIFFNIHSIVATPDGPLLFFWAGSMFYFFKVCFEGNHLRDWLLAGIFVGLAMSSKYTAIFLYPCLVLFLVLQGDIKRLLSYKFLLSIFIALVVFTPVIYWNYLNNWASFLFQSAERARGLRGFSFHYFYQLIASQLFELTPLFFTLMFVVFFKKVFDFNKITSQMKFLLMFSLPIVVFFFGLSFRTLVKMNWILPAYLPMILLVVDYWERLKETGRTVFKYVGIPTSFVFIVATLLIILVPILPIPKGDTWTGWREIATKISHLKQEFDREKPTFIFSTEYKVSAELSFYTPFKDQILAENVYGERALQFDYWFDPKDFAGWDAILVFSDFQPFNKFDVLKLNFSKVEFFEEFKIIRKGKVFRTFYIYRCYDYKPNY
ncbi:MAG: glycosyltransferase family 39 protein [Ignavibacteria bacterium]|nr:glycosyltransferase family 39 protein [Ignavibacteria bacterium]